jgi:hypothetical protein
MLHCLYVESKNIEYRSFFLINSIWENERKNLDYEYLQHRKRTMIDL